MEVKKLLAMSQALWDRIEEYRWKHRISSESQAMRDLIEAGLKVLEKKPPKAS